MIQTHQSIPPVIQHSRGYPVHVSPILSFLRVSIPSPSDSFPLALTLRSNTAPSVSTTLYCILPSGRTCWTVKGDWPEVERNAVDYLIDACASSQKYGAAALPSNCAVLELLETCHELELAYRVN